MNEVKKDELKQTYGGAIHFGTCAAVVAGIVFLIGVVDGYLRPLPCHK